MAKKKKKLDSVGLLTKRQMEILRLVRDYQRVHGYSPTMQELADELEVSKVTVFEHVEALIRKGFMERLPHKARSLRLNSEVRLPDEQGARVPLVGRIAAGVPIEAIETTEAIDLEEMFCGEDIFALCVKGDSMIEDSICDGDIVVVSKRNTARNGETVVALVDNEEATLKRFFKEKGGRVRLQPANEAYEPIIVPADSVQIQGIVVGVMRKL